MNEVRRLSGRSLADAMRDSRAATLSCLADLSLDQWAVPQRAGINPPAWELAHIGWFAEFWILRGPHRATRDGYLEADRPSRYIGPDSIFDSARLPWSARWEGALPGRAEVLEQLEGQIEACIAALPGIDDEKGLYFHRLALFHEDMHYEALCWMRSALGYPAPEGRALPEFPTRNPVRIPGAVASIGAPGAAEGFTFDNERPGYSCTLNSYEIDASPVTAGQFLEFVEAGGYDLPTCWPGAAGAWRAQAGRSHPERWRKTEGWQHRWFDRWLPLELDRPVIHVNAWEAEAYAIWADRRLPSAAEWEHASDRIDWGQSVWEWTADSFVGYPGFTADAYRDYSAPWFHNHRELRGGAFATQSRMQDHRYRNFFEPQRSDVFAGFRTARTIL